RPSTATCRSLISKSANFLPLCSGEAFVALDLVCAIRVAGTHPRGSRDRHPQQALVKLLLVAAGVAPSRGHFQVRAVSVAELKSAVGAFDELGHVTLLSRQPRQLPDPLREV